MAESTFSTLAMRFRRHSNPYSTNPCLIDDGQPLVRFVVALDYSYNHDRYEFFTDRINHSIAVNSESVVASELAIQCPCLFRSRVVSQSNQRPLDALANIPR